MKKILAFVLVFLLLFTAVIAFSDRYSHLEIFAQALHTIKTQHVHPRTDENMIFSAIKGILLDLDPYSQILRQKDFEELKKEASGNHYGIGLEVERIDDALLVLSVLKESPADKASILPGDQLLKLNERSTKKMTTLEFKKFLKTNQSFKLLIRRDDKVLVQSLTAKPFKVESTFFREIEQGIFYLKIHKFTNKSTLEVNKALKKKNIQALLIDVRNNPGGVLEESYKIADLFLKKGVIARYKLKTDKQETFFKAHQSPYLGDFPIVVLINEFSASASELLAAALQDHKRAYIIGRQSFGKGLIQNVFPLKRNYFLFLSVGEYKTPLGKTIHKKGIEPDVIIPPKKVSFKRYKNYKKDPEVSQALNLVKTFMSNR